MEKLKELREKYQFYADDSAEKLKAKDFSQISEEAMKEVYAENKLVLQLINERIKGDSIFEEALADIALYPQSDGDNTKDVADAMRVLAIGALDKTSDISS